MSKVGDKFVVIANGCMHEFKIGETVMLNYIEDDGCHSYNNDADEEWYAFQSDVVPMKTIKKIGIKALAADTASLESFVPKMGKTYYYLGADENSELRQGSKIVRTVEPDHEPYYFEVKDSKNASDRRYATNSTRFATKKQIIKAGIEAIQKAIADAPSVVVGMNIVFTIDDTGTKHMCEVCEVYNGKPFFGILNTIDMTIGKEYYSNCTLASKAISDVNHIIVLIEAKEEA